MSAGIHLIAATGLSGQIGLEGKVPWHGDPKFAEHTERDLDQFARMTAGGILVMGTVTAKNLPKNFNLGGRELCTWSRSERWASPAEFLIELRTTYKYRDIWICGGQKVYELFIPFVDWHHISVIPYDGPADRYLPPVLPIWQRAGARRYHDYAEPAAVRVCPRRDATCPHGMACPYNKGWDCSDPAFLKASIPQREADDMDYGSGRSRY